MGFADLWSRTLVYFGIAEEDEDWDENGYVTNEELERSYSERPNVRRLQPRRREREFEDWTDAEPRPRAATARAPRPARVPPPLGPLDLSPVVGIFVLYGLKAVIDTLLDRL